MKPLMSPQLILKQLEWCVGHQVISLNGQGGHSAVHLDEAWWPNLMVKPATKFVQLSDQAGH
ncbi:hypothetical protein PCANC_16207 [Puccinia coronata f. sp. avenae]|uniref:Uncharacterized protein n=1 Tax=Puccinia coronata f. sp. avenae TaxID=200324 RepID=A0A2N5UF54_9BASI|nr:hypothetical protein PCANC_16207 [Puccinia coronata f. sp. avenae]